MGHEAALGVLLDFLDAELTQITDGVIRTDKRTTDLVRTMHVLACVNRHGRRVAQHSLNMQPLFATRVRLEQALCSAVKADAPVLDVVAYLDTPQGWEYLSRVLGEDLQGVVSNLLFRSVSYARIPIVRACLRRMSRITPHWFVIHVDAWHEQEVQETLACLLEAGVVTMDGVHFMQETRRSSSRRQRKRAFE
jgi:hypothetical protein